jgi:hypothetical protein
MTPAIALVLVGGLAVVAWWTNRSGSLGSPTVTAAPAGTNSTSLPTPGQGSGEAGALAPAVSAIPILGAGLAVIFGWIAGNWTESTKSVRERFAAQLGFASLDDLYARLIAIGRADLVEQAREKIWSEAERNQDWMRRVSEALYTATLALPNYG